MAIKNGMIVKVRDKITVPRELSVLAHDGRHVKLIDKSNHSCVLDNGNVMIKGLGVFEPDYFEPVEEVEQEVYELIIHTQNVFEQGGAYQKYDSVIEHFEESHGVRVITKGGEWFHPWTYDGGIRAVYVPA